ncbi:hypothetical protein G7046_g4916 [Stylonectria norvegica]|nr:hypothetical protein G7046_g4916 [Stylonectria norvegica]
MDPPFSNGGRASSYTNPPLLPGPGQQSSCVSEFTAADSYYVLSPATQELSPHLSEAGSLPSSSLHQQHLHQTHSPSTYGSMTSNPQFPPRSHHTWVPSPPPELDNYSYHSSPTCGSSQTCYNPSPVSPRTWSSPDQAFQQTTEQFQPSQRQDSYKDVRFCTPASTEDFALRPSQMPRAYTGNFNQSLDSDVEYDGTSRHQSPSMMQDFPSGTMSSTTSPSEPALGTPNFLAAPMKEESPLGDSASSPSRQADAKANAKGEEPYAQLIFKAFMSRPEYSMTLQEIYQWFRDNTDKAKSESKGWQNSIRHNLSMNAISLPPAALPQCVFVQGGPGWGVYQGNADSVFPRQAFTKRERKQAAGSAPPTATSVVTGQPLLSAGGDPKRSTEWVLEDWAVRDGVQSTTRYRKGNQARRGHGNVNKNFHYAAYPHGMHPHGHHQISTSKVASRKGGCATSKAKLRSSRHYSHGTTMSPTSHGIGIGIMPQALHGPHPIRRPTVPGMMYNPYACDDLLVPRLETPHQHMSIKQEVHPSYQQGHHSHQNHSPLTPEPTAADHFGLMIPGPSLAHHHGVGGSTSGTSYNALAGMGVGMDVSQGMEQQGMEQGFEQPQQQMYQVPSSQCGGYPYTVADVTGVYSAGPEDSGRLFEPNMSPDIHASRGRDPPMRGEESTGRMHEHEPHGRRTAAAAAAREAFDKQHFYRRYENYCTVASSTLRPQRRGEAPCLEQHFPSDSAPPTTPPPPPPPPPPPSGAATVPPNL